MRATIVADDNQVIVDGGSAHIVNCSDLTAEGVHAVQWYDTYGEVEYNQSGFDQELKLPIRPSNEHIDDFSPYQTYVDQWYAKEAIRVQEEAEAQVAEKIK